MPMTRSTTEETWEIMDLSSSSSSCFFFDDFLKLRLLLIDAFTLDHFFVLGSYRLVHIITLLIVALFLLFELASEPSLTQLLMKLVSGNNSIPSTCWCEATFVWSGLFLCGLGVCLTDEVGSGVLPLCVAGVFIVMLREMDPKGACEQLFIGRGRVILLDDGPSLVFEGILLNTRVTFDSAHFFLPFNESMSSSSSKMIEDNGTFTAANKGSSVTLCF
mmetsp:Transcript_25447/g.36314  ORF Transcript_25447/g.36314 Transcript_25447/m.36314 type:complete len:218 (-) Transcript_25447:1715-2368(-)